MKNTIFSIFLMTLPCHAMEHISLTEVLKKFGEIEIADLNAYDTDGWTPLHRAIRENDFVRMQELIAQGADVNKPDGIAQWTPLHCAATKGNIDMVKLLLAQHADTNAKNIVGITALHHAMQRHNKQIVITLLKNGAEFELAENLQQCAFAFFIEDDGIQKKLEETLQINKFEYETEEQREEFNKLLSDENNRKKLITAFTGFEIDKEVEVKQCILM